jgi:tetratricopeptide (TPR) repeat protein
MKAKIIFIIVLFAVSAGASYYFWQGSSSTPDTSPSALNLPDLDRPIHITANLPEDAKKIALEKIKDLSDKLKENPDLFNYWLELGVYRKMINDYEGAKEAWEYAGVIRPKNSISFNNLGDLYGYYLKDQKKAEDNFLRAVENGTDKIFIYRNLYEFYRYVLKDNEKSRQILEKGIRLNPDTSQDLQVLLDNF